MTLARVLHEAEFLDTSHPRTVQQVDRGPLRVIVTGFGPFQGVASNPSAEMVRQLGSEELVVGHIWDGLAQVGLTRLTHTPDEFYGPALLEHGRGLWRPRRDLVVPGPDNCEAFYLAPSSLPTTQSHECLVLETSAAGSLESLEEIHVGLAKGKGAGGLDLVPCETLFVHLGVLKSIQGFRLVGEVSGP